jgi:hypothetical protein
VLPGFLSLLAKLAFWNYLPTRRHARGCYDRSRAGRAGAQSARLCATKQAFPCCALVGPVWLGRRRRAGDRKVLSLLDADIRRTMALTGYWQ